MSDLKRKKDSGYTGRKKRLARESEQKKSSKWMQNYFLSQPGCSSTEAGSHVLSDDAIEEDISEINQEKQRNIGATSCSNTEVEPQVFFKCNRRRRRHIRNKSREAKRNWSTFKSKY